MFDTTQLFSLQRGGFSEVVVAGDIVVHDGQKIIFQKDYDQIFKLI